METLDHLRIATIVAFAEGINVLRDPYEDGHGERVAKLAEELALELNHPGDFIELLKYGARLHDVGKVMIAENVLNKVKLTASEKKMVCSHAAFGAEVISRLGFEDAIHIMVRHHHENWDGSGYPDGLRDEAIPLGARIIRVADCFDAMTNRRVYRKVFSTHNTIGAMKKERGTSFDPTIFDAFKRMMAE